MCMCMSARVIVFTAAVVSLCELAIGLLAFSVPVEGSLCGKKARVCREQELKAPV